MKKYRIFSLFLLLILAFFAKTSQVNAAQSTINVPVDGGGTEQALLSLPDDYNSNSNSYPLFIFHHGLGESVSNSGGNLNAVTLYGAFGAASSNSGYVNPKDGQTYKFIVLAPQFCCSWPSSGEDMDKIVQYMVNTYRVNANRIYASGLSYGASPIFVSNAHIAAPGHPSFNPMYKFAAEVLMSGALNSDQQSINQTISDQIHVWGLGDMDDFHGINTSVYMAGLGSTFGRFTAYDCPGNPHGCWGTYYDPGYKESVNIDGTNTPAQMNIYEWMLQFSRGSSGGGGNNPPTANAGTAQTITLPTSTVTLSGSGSDPGGSISSYAWTQVSGTGATITSPSTASTNITGLSTSGARTFRLTVTDNQGATGTSDVTITVNAASGGGTTVGNQLAITVPINGSGGTEQALLKLPDDYNSTSTSYPLLVFLHGAGEPGTTINDLSRIYNSSTAGGPAYFIAQNAWPSSFTSNGQSYKFIVVSPQSPSTSSTSGVQLKYIIDNIVANYRVNTNKIYVTGLSAGGVGTFDYVARNGVTPTYPVAAYAPMSMAIGYVNQATNNAIIAENIYVWGFGSSPGDWYGTITKYFIEGANNGGSALPPGLGSHGRYTNYSGNHCCWNSFYDPGYKELVNGTQMNIYEWMLQFSRGSSGPTNQYPTATISTTTASITLPTSTGSITGSCNDTDGTIASCTWTKLSGPSATITNTTAGTSATTTTVTGMTTAGTYIFRLTATDNIGATGTSDVTITVNVASGGGTSTPYSPQQVIPGTVQAEFFDNGGQGTAYNDSTTGNSGGALRATDVDILSGADGGSAYGVGWTTNGEWLKYTTNVTAGIYTISVRAATPNTGKTLSLSMDGVSIGTVNIASTGSFGSYANNAGPTLALTGGSHVLQLTMNTGSTDSTQGFDINYLTFTSVPGSTNQNPTANAGTAQTVTLPTSTVTLSGSGTDPDGTISTYAWTQVSGPTSTIATPALASTLVTGLTSGTYVFRLTVTDNQNATGTATVTITVNPVNIIQPPVGGGGGGGGGNNTTTPTPNTTTPANPSAILGVGSSKVNPSTLGLSRTSIPVTGIKKGVSSVNNVKNLQTFLNWVLGPKITPLVPDGKWGAKTTNAIKLYQASNGLKVDGSFGKISAGKAIELLKNTQY